MEILQKHKPQNINDVVGNRVLIRDFNNNIKSECVQMLILGPPGSGKTLICDLILGNQKVFDVLKISGEESEDIKGLKSLVDNFTTNRTIESFFSKKKKLVFFDNIDILLNCDRYVNNYLLSFVENAIKSKSVSFVMTCSSSEEKKLTELKKKISCVRLTNPSPKDAYVYMSNILDKEEIDYEPSKLMKIIEVHNGNIRNTMNNLHQMELNEEGIRNEKELRFLFDSNIFDVTKKLLKKKVSTCELKMVSDNNLIPLLLYENYLVELFKNKTKQKKDVYFDTIVKVTDIYIAAEKLENFMYAHTDWSIYDNVTILKCGSINTQLSKYETKKSPTFDKYVFAQVLTKSALRCHYNKRLNSLKSNIGMYDSSCLFYLMDCLAAEMEHNVERLKGFKMHLTQFVGDNSDDMSTIYQYFSQFLNTDKTLLAKIKKL